MRENVVINDKKPLTVMYKCIINYIYLSVSCVLLVSCVNLRIDETKNDALWKPFNRNATYYLKEDVFILPVDSGKEPNRLALVPESTEDRGTGFYSSPKRVSDYKNDPDKASIIYSDYGSSKLKIVGIVEKGTKLKPCQIKNNVGWDVWFGNDTYATRYFMILSGEFSGNIVDVEDLHWKPNKYLSEEY